MNAIHHDIDTIKLCLVGGGGVSTFFY